MPTMHHSPRPNPAHLLFLAASVLLLQSTAPAQLAHEGPAKAIALAATLAPYDVISIKQNNSETESGSINIDDHGIFTVTNMPLQSIVEFAYDVKSDQISALSGPVNTARFDVTAKVLPPDDGPPHMLPDVNLQAMVVLLLADRFQLKAHLQPKVVPVYDLVVAHGGPKVKLTQDERHSSSWNINGENTSKVLTGKSDSMTDLADALSDLAGRKVIDKTGLSGSADITLKWSDEVAMEQGGANVVSIFTALEEQLGLKLQPSKGPVDTLIVDHVEMPSEN
jgi:uncharacterized protein (TIGR03435 family)